MLLPIELFHVCVRIHIDDLGHPTGHGTGSGTCRTRGACSGNKAFPASPAARVRRRAGACGSGYWRSRVCGVRGLARAAASNVARGRRVYGYRI
jgi:hypothetical protein